MIESRVTAVIVTYNRIELLKESIQSIQAQTVSVENLIIINNCSTDGTTKYLEKISNDDKDILVINTENNIGGAGGFYTGVREFLKTDAQFVWLMDDDTIPSKDALEKLLDAGKVLNNNFGYLCSNVRWVDNSPALMNIPRTAKEWTDYAQSNLIKLDTCSFVSMLVSRPVIEKVGLPIRQFFIWGDDLEYSGRISKLFPSYFVADSIIIHKMNANNPVNIVDDNPQRIGRYYFNFRNLFYVFRKKSHKELLKYIFRVFSDTFAILKLSDNNKIKRLKTMWWGFFAGIFFNPQIEFFRNEEK